MQPLPHIYKVGANAEVASAVTLTSEGVPALMSASPREFDGPGDQWSPESLFIASLASCFILTFRAVARASKLEWTKLECTVEGALERVEGVTQFTRVLTRAKLQAPSSASEDLCARVLEKSERGCLVANSVRAQRELRFEIEKA